MTPVTPLTPDPARPGAGTPAHNDPAAGPGGNRDTGRVVTADAEPDTTPATRLAAALEIADRYAAPDEVSPAPSWWPQSLAHGAPGLVLLHTEVAAAGLRPAARADVWMRAAVRSGVTVGACTGPFYGGPAIWRVLTGVAVLSPAGYRSARDAVAERVGADIADHAARAHARLDTADREGGPHAVVSAPGSGRSIDDVLPRPGEFDALRGLAGLGAHLLHHDPAHPALRAALRALVRLTQPVRAGAGLVPGWWTPVGPSGRPDPDFPGGHGNAGMAHGVSGPLALLSLAYREQITVPGHREAIDTICAWLDTWSTGTGTGTGLRWPYLITRDELDGTPGRAHDGARRRPSWCYGLAGIARAVQLAALVTGDTAGRRRAERALLGALSDPAQTSLIIDASLCHGHLGLARIAGHAADDADACGDTVTATTLRAAASGCVDRALRGGLVTDGPGLLEGDTGAALALLGAATGTTATAWDTCLLIRARPTIAHHPHRPGPPGTPFGDPKVTEGRN